MLETLLTDLRFSARSLRHSIGFASVAVLSLALGIGASGALFSLVDAVFFRPFPVHEPDRLVALYSVRLSDASWSGTSYPDYLNYREQTDVFAGLMAYIRIPLSFDAGGRTELLSGEHVTSNYFEALGLGMAAGRGFRAEEDRPGAPHPVLVISDGLWQRAFGGDPSAVGRPVRIHGRSFRHSRLRSGLVVAEVALSLVLLSGAGLFVRTLVRAQSIDLGLRLDNVLVLSVDFNSMRSRYDESKATQFYRSALERVRSVPGVVAATWGGDVPLARRRLLIGFVKEGTTVSGEADWIRGDVNITGPRYLETLGIRLVRGRDFTDRDNESSAIGAAIINETMARRYWPGEDPLGRRVRLRHGARELYEIVGISGDVRQRSIWGEPAPYLYVPLYQRYFPVMMLHVRSVGNPMTMLPVLEREFAALDPDLPVFDAKTLRTQMAEALAVERTAAALLGAAGLLALVLAVSGVYSIMAYSVARRTREIGIRMALGARQRVVLAMVLRQGMTLAVLGILTGIGTAWALSWLIAGYLHGASPTDPLTYASVAMILAAAAALACYVPSRRAARIDPATALRRE
jgi:hypothetical protein